jgi:hypothetical protein
MRTGPDIVKDGLVFHYDLTDEKSFYGVPTTNVVNPSWSEWSIDGSGQGSIGTRTILSPYHCRIIDSSSNTRQFIWINSFSPNTTYVFSVKYKKLFGTPTLRFQIGVYNGGTPITAWFPTTREIEILDVDGWQTARYTITTPPNTTIGYWYMQDGDDYTTYTHTFELKEPQVEQRTYPTTFTSSSRGNTTSLYDRINRTPLDLSAVSFTSRGMMSFDGSNDQIVLDDYASVIPYGTNANITVETVVKWNDIVPNGVIVGYGGNGTGGGFLLQVEFSQGLEFSIFGGGQSGRASILIANSAQYANKYIHMVGTYNGSVIKLYIDGVEVASQNYSYGYPQQSYFRLGNEYNRSYYANIDLPILRIYNKSLTISEVQKNYNTFKEKYMSSILEIDGEWVKVFRHYSGRAQFFSSDNDWAEAKRVNPLNPQADKYSILDTVKNYRIDDKYTFKLVYPTLGVTNIWSQTNNPVTDPGTGGVSSYSAISIDRSENGWGGLERYDTQTATFLDGTLTPVSNWYYAIGVKDPWNGATTFPGPNEAVDLVELWIKY